MKIDLRKLTFKWIDKYKESTNNEVRKKFNRLKYKWTKRSLLLIIIELNSRRKSQIT